ncbi:MAG: hypothetical protein M3198_04580, partial [Actinomycetota bacterium]|nr:hypothetical protein [Actinomycetota bacterium]
QNAEKVEVTLTDRAATGTFTLADGRQLPFTATPATGVAGLYQATLARDGRLTGPSETGGRLVARLAEANAGKPVITGTFADPEGNTVPLKTPGGKVNPGDVIRFIVLPDGRFEGKVRQTGGSFSCWFPF